MNERHKYRFGVTPTGYWLDSYKTVSGIPGVIHLVISTSAVLSANADGGRDQEVTFAVDKMTCSTCPITVRKAM